MKNEISNKSSSVTSHNIRVLIIGAGVAGLTLAALLRQRGERPVIIEKQPEDLFHEAGYMLGLLPLGGRVLNALDKQKEYLEQSCPMKTYSIHDGSGKKLNSYSLTKINNQFGPYRGISRKKLVNILREAAGDISIHFDTTATAIRQDPSGVTVTMNDNSVSQFDMVVIADGLHSKTRQLILDEHEYNYKATGWGGWVTWIDSAAGFENSYNEFWGAGSFLGLYPVKGQIGAFLGGPVNRLEKTGREVFAGEIQDNFEKPVAPVQKALQAFKELEDPYFWNFHDCKTKSWIKGRVVLLGDAATGFLPTAGIGASMAMDSAAVLNDELSRADSNHLDYALTLYENRQKEKVERAQKESRDLGKWMFIESGMMAWLRNKILGYYNLEMMLKGLESIMMGK